MSFFNNYPYIKYSDLRKCLEGSKVSVTENPRWFLSLIEKAKIDVDVREKAISEGLKNFKNILYSNQNFLKTSGLRDDSENHVNSAIAFLELAMGKDDENKQKLKECFIKVLKESENKRSFASCLSRLIRRSSYRKVILELAKSDADLSQALLQTIEKCYKSNNVCHVDPSISRRATLFSGFYFELMRLYKSNNRVKEISI